MRKILLGIDLAICSLWTIAALGSRIAWVDTPVTWIVMLPSNPQLSPSMSFLRVHVLSLLNYHIN